jgi:hypothetical protein
MTKTCMSDAKMLSKLQAPFLGLSVTCKERKRRERRAGEKTRSAGEDYKDERRTARTTQTLGMPQMYPFGSSPEGE